MFTLQAWEVLCNKRIIILRRMRLWEVLERKWNASCAQLAVQPARSITGCQARDPRLRHGNTGTWRGTCYHGNKRPNCRSTALEPLVAARDVAPEHSVAKGIETDWALIGPIEQAPLVRLWRCWRHRDRLRATRQDDSPKCQDQGVTLSGAVDGKEAQLSAGARGPALRLKSKFSGRI